MKSLCIDDLGSVLEGSVENLHRSILHGGVDWNSLVVDVLCVEEFQEFNTEKLAVHCLK